MTIEEWTDAFNVSFAVYNIKFPEQSEHLSSYLDTVRKKSNENGNWYYNDTKFCRIKKALGYMQQVQQGRSALVVTIDTSVRTAGENTLGIDVEKSTVVDKIKAHKQKLTNKRVFLEQVPVIRNNPNSQSLPTPVNEG